MAKTYVITAPNGKKYRVTGEGSKEDALRHLQEQLNATVEAAPPKTADETWAAARGHENVPEFVPPGVEGYDPKTGEVTTGTGPEAFVYGASDIPVVGPALKAGEAAVAAGLTAPGSDLTYGERYNRLREMQEATMASHPKSALAGNIAGTALVLRGAPKSVGGKYLGLTGGLGTRTGYGALSGGAINAADVAARGGDMGDVLKAAAVGTATGAVLPAVGDAIVGGGGYLLNKAGSIIRSAYDPAAEALKRLGSAFTTDASSAAGVLSPQDIAAAARSGQPLINADLGGETVRALARATANQSPEARGRLEKVVSDRFGLQGDRVVRLVNRLTGGRTDDIMAQDALRDLAAAQNKPAYDKAYNSPSAQTMWNQTFGQLLQAPAVQSAVRDAERRGANRAAAQGFRAVKNPFVEVNGQFQLRNPNVKPTLQFWDQVKRNLDSDIGTAKRSGDNTLTADLTALKNKLVNTLDAAVPDYKAARQGAASFFGAEDAIEAGRKFAKSSKMLPEFQRGILSLKPAEKEGFETGFASELIDKARNTRDRVNVIQQMFGSPENRQKMAMAFGAPRAREIEAFVRVETAMDALRGAFGNSTTTRQLIESGVLGGGAGVGTWWYTGDFSKGFMAAAAAAGAKHAGKRIQGNVMTNMADLLLSNDPALVSKAVKSAAGNPEMMAALDALLKIGSSTTKAATLTVPSRTVQPTQQPVTLPGPEHAAAAFDWYKGGAAP